MRFGFTKVLLLLAVATLARPVAGATITGIIRAEGKAGAPTDAGGGKYDSRQFKFVERVNYDELHDFIIYIDGPVAFTNAAAGKPVQVVTRRVEQKGAMFTPHVMPVLVGTTVEWPNEDKILHNVFSFSEAKEFDLGLYQSPEVKSVTFDKAGRVDVFCSIHTRMSCIILVLPNPFFAAANERGGYSITNVPPGTYKLKAWHERLPPMTQEIVVPAEGTVKLDFTMGIKGLPKP